MTPEPRNPAGLNSSQQGEPSSTLFVIPREDFVHLIHQQREVIESLVKEDAEKVGQLEEQISEAKFDLTVHRSLLKLLEARWQENH